MNEGLKVFLLRQFEYSSHLLPGRHEREATLKLWGYVV